jgi:4-amino-4-deoxy-L-arabinose transferase-like glycosyltransferase
MAAHPSPRDLTVGAGIAAAVMLTRLPFRGAMLYHWDSINFARALDRFDVAAAQPHIPGYLLYVLIGRATRWMLGDAQGALVAIAIVGSGLATAMLYVLASEMFDRRVGLIAALGFASSPLFWFYGEIALPHAFDAFLIVSAVWLAWRIIEGAHHLILVLAVWLALTGAIRPQSETFLMPLTLYAVARMGWTPHLPLALALWIGCNLAWLLPLLSLSGGAAAYAETSRVFYARFSDSTTLWTGGLWGLRRNALKLGMYTAYGWSLGAVALLLLARPRVRRGWRAWIRDARAHVLGLWMLPALGVYLFVHMGQQGLVLAFLPALWLISALLVRTLPAVIAAVVAAFIITANAALFLLAPTYPLGGDRPKLLTIDTLQRHDAALRARIAAVRERFPAAHTMLLSSGWRFPEFYLAEYPLAQYGIGARWEVDEGRPTSGRETWVDPERYGARADAHDRLTVVLFDDELSPFNRSTDRVEWIPLGNGQRLPVLHLHAGEGLQLLPTSFRIAPLSGAGTDSRR